jgi:hypothetical protein
MCRHHRELPRLVLSGAIVLSCGFTASRPALAGPTHGGLTSLHNFALHPAAGQVGRFGYALASGDFDNDGRGDLAVGRPNDVTNGAYAGAVDLFLSTGTGLYRAGTYHGPAGSNTGWTLAASDFDGNGSDELAVARIGETISGATGAGKVVILGWDPLGLQLVELQSFHQGLALLGETPETDDRFGWKLAAADFNADGFGDLAVGVPYENLGTVEIDQGIVHVLYGFGGGLTTLGSQTWSQDSPSIIGQAQNTDYFGLALAAGDFDGDGPDDLAIGVPYEPSGAIRAGAVAVLYGVTNSGLSAAGNQLWAQGLGLPGVAEQNDGFGLALAAGDFNNDTRDDLAIGVPGDTIQGVVRAGSVLELRGAATGLVAAGNNQWTSDDFGLPVTIDDFGNFLTTGDFDGDHRADLAIGSPYAWVGATANAGHLDVIPGSAAGLSAVRHTRWSAQGLATSPAQNQDNFAFALASGDFDNDGEDDLFIGIPGRPPGALPLFTGAVQVLRGGDALFSDDLEDGNVAGWSAHQP